ncbi:MAG: DNA translocase FtsK 4TM domain-containing protein [Beijerinckiaceae bacterium]
MRNAALSHLPGGGALGLRHFAARRLAEFSGAILVLGVIVLGLALATWSTRDPSLNHATDGPVRNILGARGAIAADLLTQILGISSIVLIAPAALFGWRLMTERSVDRPRWRISLWLTGTVLAAALASMLPTPGRWPLPSGMGGLVGDGLTGLVRKFSSGYPLVGLIATACLALGALLCLAAACTRGQPADESSSGKGAPVATGRVREQDDEPGAAIASLGAILHACLAFRAAIARQFSTLSRQESSRGSAEDIRPKQRVEPDFAARDFEERDWKPKLPPLRDRAAQAEASRNAQAQVAPPAPPLRQGRRASREAQPGLFDKDAYRLPALGLLADAKKTARRVSEDALGQNARLLEGVLDDFGVKGEIVNVRPGPVVTLYELEPAPGVKSSRVIGLADDIARSMSAISARVAVVQGRNAIGVELPNHDRETVYLRELLGATDFETSRHRLAIALGKTIGGEPVIVDLARMPHLLVAGTTGSGKSVAINTMILSLLYRLRPEQCRLIMVDPKMLELSVYDGIPHLLTPVVTDPRKAVVALKWAVREMEDRYKKMSRLGVRNIDGFNARLAEAAQKNETLSRTVQTGFDRETGEAIYEQEEMSLSPLPYIVIVVDEMADLMMVAGKDIEGAIQRLAQMARAAGIHLIMATQRPSVDVITGTIKANFPTRISFQVTSKIDSRTILGEQGAEQLLGQGDMLYMAGGGRISRVHGPFVSDAEVEKVVAHLKQQGAPEYLEAITAEDDEDEDGGAAEAASGFGDEAGDLYDRAVNIVLRDRKCSVSYIQRRLSVGYNKAASLVERMEQEGVVGKPSHSGKREILVGNGVDRGAFEPSEAD